MELGPEDVSLLEKCPHFRGYYVCVLCSSCSLVSHYRVHPVTLERVWST